MRKVNYKKKQQLKNIGRAMALTIALITYNVSTKTYAMELETKVSTYSTIEQEKLSAKVVDNKTISPDATIDKATTSNGTDTIDVDKKSNNQFSQKRYNNRQASMGLLLGALLGIFISNIRKKKSNK